MAVALFSEATKILSVFALSLLICYVISKWLKSWSYPPGPIGLPVVGYAHFLGRKPQITLRNLSRKYGDIFSFYIGPQLIICINDYHLAKEILTHPLTLSRPPHAFDFLIGRGGFSGMNGQEWQEQRRFAMHTMRNLGLGKGLWETMIQDDAVDFVEEIKSWKGRPTCIDEALSISEASNNVALLFGRHLDKDESRSDIEKIQRCNQLLMKNFSPVGLNISLPWITKFLEVFNVGGYKHFAYVLRDFEDIFRREVEERLSSKDALTRGDFIGCYLQEMENRNNDSKPHTFTIENLLGNMVILFIAGNESTYAGVAWLLLLMATYEDVQEKVHQEIDAVIGKDGTVCFDDKIKMPYTVATIMEMTRFISINPIYPPRYPLETFTFHGYTIPQGSHILCNIWSIMHDPKYFEKPMEFKPERFLTDDGLKVKKPTGYAPFSFGKRNCPGEVVAIMTIYLYFVSIMQKFKIKTPHGLPADFDYVFGGALLPRPQKLCFIER